VSLHDWLGRHVADLKVSRWDHGQFVSRCTICAKPMVKPPGLTWQLQSVVG
jgi:hypothetical protein